MHKISKRIAAGGLALGLSLSAGIACAAWTTQGFIKAEDGRTAIVVAPTAEDVTVVDELYPGSHSAVKGNLCNTNKVPVEVTGLTSPAVMGFAAHVWTTVDLTALNTTWIGPNDCTPFTLDNAVYLMMDAPNSEQGKTFTFTIGVNYKVLPPA